jgi:mRNA-degrading endonuclease toxin of MazEF toxin-antitoxin module
VAARLSEAATLRWAVVRVDIDPAAGHEQGGQRRALVVSYEPFHRSGLATVCPISAARPDARYPGEVAIPVGAAGQTRPGVILCQQLRTIALERVVGGPEGRLTDPELRRAVRAALAHHLGLDIPAIGDGAVRRP